MRTKFFCTALFLLFLASSHDGFTWNQGTHRQINYEAVNVFYRQMEGKKKYLLGPLPDELRKEPYRGIAVTSSGLDVGHYRIAEILPEHLSCPSGTALGKIDRDGSSCQA